MQQLASPAGWTALLLTVAAAAWLEGRFRARNLLHVFSSLAVGAVVLAACGLPAMVTERAADTQWMASHLLVGGWTAVVLLITALGIAGQKIRLRGQSLLDANAVSGWALAVGIAVLISGNAVGAIFLGVLVPQLEGLEIH